MTLNQACYCRFAFSSATSSFFDSFPIGVFGNCSRNSISAGISILAMRAVRNSTISSWVTRCAGAKLDERLRRFTAILVGNADHGDLIHGRMLINRFLDPARVDVEARAENDVLDPVDDIGEAVLIHIGDVAGPKILANEGVGGFAWSVPVSLHDLRAADANLAPLAKRRFAFRSAELAQGYDRARQRQADGSLLGDLRQRD